MILNQIWSRPTYLTVLLIIVSATHRLTLFLLHYSDLNALLTDNPDWLTFQYLTVPALRDHLWLSLLYLQQTPPLPNLILGLALQVCQWPFQIAYLLIAGQTLLTLVTATLLFRILYLWQPRYIMFQWIVVLLFVLNTDLLVMEYNSFGQTGYENLAMLLVTALVYVFVKFQQTRDNYYILLLGTLVGLLALTRATYSYVAVVVFGMLLVDQRRRLLQLGLFAAVVLLLQGGWALKNYLIYDYFAISTSSWKGGNLAVGLDRAGFGEPFKRFILHESQDLPDWFVQLIKDHGLVYWSQDTILNNYIPDEFLQQDEAIKTLLKGTQRPQNSIAQRVLFDTYALAYQQFLINSPELIWAKLVTGYEYFWQPIKYYSIFYIDLFCVEVVPVKRGLWETVNALATERTPEKQRIMQGTYRSGVNKFATGLKPGDFYTIGRFSNDILLFNLVTLHLMVPLTCLVILGRYLTRKTLDTWESTYVFGSLLYGYAAFAFNLPEFGENMRFRLSVEPIIWLLTVTAIIAWMKFVMAALMKRLG
jgi:hypothetical protein